MNAPPTPFERFLTRMMAMAAQRPSSGSYELYEQFKAEAQNLDLTPEQYQRAMQAAARAAGV